MIVRKLSSMLTYFEESRRAALLRKINRSQKQVRRATIANCAFWLMSTGIVLWAVGGLKGAAFILKVSLVSIIAAIAMDVDLDKEDRRSAVHGMLSSLDEKSGVISRQRGEAMDPVKGQSQVSAGFITSFEETGRIIAVQEGSPAAKAGLKRGDRVLQLFSMKLAEYPDTADIFLKALDAGNLYNASKVVPITVLRGSSEIDVDLTLEKWDRKAAYDIGVKNGIPHIYLSDFGVGSADDVADILATYVERGPVSEVVIDLRGNSGGLASEGRKLASLFVPKGTVVARQTARSPFFRGKQITERREMFPQIERIGVIIDEDSASASESFAAFVQDLGLGAVAGEVSYGKGSSQACSFEFNIDPFCLTVARFTGPKGTPIDGVGVKPTITVESDSSGNNDWHELIERVRKAITQR